MHSSPESSEIHIYNFDVFLCDPTQLLLAVFQFPYQGCINKVFNYSSTACKELNGVVGLEPHCFGEKRRFLALILQVQRVK